MKNIKMTTKEKWTLTVLVLMSVFPFADQNAMNPVIKDIMVEYKETIKLLDIRTIFMNKTNWLGFIQCIPGCIPWAKCKSNTTKCQSPGTKRLCICYS